MFHFFLAVSVSRVVFPHDFLTVPVPGFKLSRSALQEALSPGCSGLLTGPENGGELVPPICGHFSRGKTEEHDDEEQGIWMDLGFAWVYCTLLSDKPDWYFLSTQKLGDGFNPTYILMKLVAALDEKNIWRCPFHLQDWSMRRTMVSCKISIDFPATNPLKEKHGEILEG